MFQKTGLAVISLLLLASTANAAPVKVAGSQKENGILGSFSDGKMILSVGAEYDNVFERELETDGTEVEFNAVAGELALEYDGKVKAYATLGQAINNKVNNFNFFGIDLDLELENGFMWGGGLSVKQPLEVMDLEGIDIFTDGSYRQTSDLNYDSVSRNGLDITDDANILNSSTDFNWKEWHVAVGLSKDFKIVAPYAGVRYSDVKASGKLTISGLDFNIEDTNADKNFGVFVGTILNPAESIKLNIQGRFIDEMAVMASASYLF